MTSSVTASAAKQSSAQYKPPLDCFVARAPRNDEFSRSRNALLRPSHSSSGTKAGLRRTGGDVFASTREAERRTAHLVQEPHPENSKVRAWPRPDKRDRSPFGAPPRSCARDSPSPTRPGPRFLESPDPNGRTLSGTSAVSTSQSGQVTGRYDAQAACRQK
jgi:hypothetical protein